MNGLSNGIWLRWQQQKLILFYCFYFTWICEWMQVNVCIVPVHVTLDVFKTSDVSHNAQQKYTFQCKQMKWQLQSKRLIR